MNRVLQVPSRVGPLQVDDFPEGCKRERKGALHIRPSSTLVVSEDELAHLKKEHPELAARLQDITPTAPPPQPETPTVVPVPDPPTEERRSSGRRSRKSRDDSGE